MVFFSRKMEIEHMERSMRIGGDASVMGLSSQLYSEKEQKRYCIDRGTRSTRIYL
jgi:hypothetical protein